MGAPHPDARQAIILVCAAAFLWMLAVPADGASYIHLGLGLESKPPAAVDAGPVVAPVPASAASPPLPRRRRRRLDEEYRAAGLRLAPDPMFWSHTAVSDWTAEDLGLPWCAQLFRTLEIDGPKLLGLLGVATPYGHAREGSSQPNSGSGRAAVEALDTAGLATFLAEHEGRTVQFDHGMGVKPTPLPRRKGKDLRSTVAQQADQVAAGVARALRACVLNSSTCPSSATFPVAPSIREHAEAETARQASLVSAADPLPVFAPDSVMEQRQPGARGWPHGTCAGPVQAAGGLRFGSDPQLAQRICCHNRHNAEHRWYFRRTAWSDSMSRPPTPPALSTPDGVGDDGTAPARQDTAAALNYYDVVTGKRMFVAPRGRSAEAFYRESLAHGWPSFRDEEVDWANVRSLRNGEMVSLDGTHLGHNIPDHHGNRYCINLVCVSGHAAPQPPPQPVPLAVLARGGAAADTRVRGMLWGLFTGNALGMPSMWFYRPPGQIVEAFGPTGITGFVAPPARHPGSIMSAFWNSDREHVRDVVGKVILHGRESVWQTPGSHYHSGLRAGDNTLNARLVEVLMQSLSRAACAGDPRGGQQRDSGSSGLPNPGDSIGYDPDAYLAAYIRFMMTPGMHEDSYADTAHIQFFYKYSQGKSPRECVGVENHSTGNIGSTVGLPVLMAATAGAGRAGATAGDGDMTPASFATAEQAVVQHVGLTHRSARLMAHVRVMCRLFARLLRGVALRAAVRLAGADLGIDFDRLLADATARQRPHRRPPSPPAPTSTAEVEGGGTQGSSAAGRLPSEPFVDLPVVTQAFGLACYIHDALPTTLYLAFKYHEPAQAAAGLLANANLGGNTADRGAILGAILGAAHGPAVLRDWSSQLARRAALQESIDSFVGALSLARSDSLVTADRDRL